MIGASIGTAPIGADSLSASPVILGANIFLSGTLDFYSSFRLARRVATFLNFGVITNDDNVVQVALTNTLTGLPVNVANSQVTVSIYAPGTDSSPVIVKDGDDIVLGDGYFQFPITHSDVGSLAAGTYPWVAVITLVDGTRHTVNCGDINLSTGYMQVFKRPGVQNGCV